jgi:hypothetical protein
MATTYPITYPTNARLQPRNIDFVNKTLTSKFQSSFSGQTQIHRYGGQWFELNVTLPPLFQADAEEMTAFLNRLGGNYGTFLFKLPSKFMMTGSPISVTTDTTGNEFTTGATIQVGKYAYDATDKRLVQFTSATSLFPKLSPSVAHTLNTTDGVKMRLATSEVAYNVNEMMMYGVVIPMYEAI